MDKNTEMKKIRPVCVRNLTIGEGIPKICIPLTGKDEEAILSEAEKIKELPADLAEWRADWFDGVFDEERVRHILQKLREKLGELPLLFTFRTAAEGGEKEIGKEAYVRLNSIAAESGCADLIDAEFFSGQDVTGAVIQNAQKRKVKVILSSHDFQKTPDKEEMICRLRQMQETGADIVKLAVMPQSRQDVLELLCATEEMNRKYADRPVVTMSMSKTGTISRLCGEVFGSAITFGSAGKESAPGQVKAADLHEILKFLHEIS